MRAQQADRFDLVFGSPPYIDARTYGIGAQRDCQDWIEWMLEVSMEAARITKGPVIWVVAGVTRKRNYQPGPEGLMYLWWKRGGDCQLYRPCVFHRVGIPGSGGRDWFRADWEYVVCLKRPGALLWADNTACGHPPKWAPGGEMSYRLSDGQRQNQWGGTDDPWGKRGRGNSLGGRNQDGSKKKGTLYNKWGHSVDSVSVGARTKSGKRDKRLRPSHRQHTKRRADGEMEVQEYAPPVLANPGNVFSIPVGGGLMGDQLCHENEAPMPEALAEIFIRSFCPEGGTVLDPFIGSGTTAKVCQAWGRNCVGVDIRESQIELVKRRLAQRLLI
jgi:hypothetical protein